MECRSAMILNSPASFFLTAKRRPQANYSAIRSWRGRLQRIAEHGRDGFYKGETAAAILKLDRQLGGFMEAEDLWEFEPEWVDPVSTTYHGWTVYEMPPNGQGIAALEMLNIMDQFPIKEWGHNSQKSLHVEIEAKKLAYADLQRYVGDPRATHIPTAALISKDLAAQRAKLITDKAACNVLPSECSRVLLVCRATPPTSRLSIVTAMRSLLSRAMRELLAAGWLPEAPASRCKIAAGDSPWSQAAKHASPAHASAAHHHSCVHAEVATGGLPSASWAASTRRRLMRSLFPTSSISA